MKIPKELNHITPFSRGVTVAIVFIVPIMTFIIGFLYGMDIGSVSEYPTINKDMLKNKRLVPTDEWHKMATKSASPTQK